MGWKTILGVVVAAVGWVGSPDGLAVLSESLASGAQALGSLFALFGLRHSIAKKN